VQHAAGIEADTKVVVLNSHGFAHGLAQHSCTAACVC
jgi:hypothetical protein